MPISFLVQSILCSVCFLYFGRSIFSYDFVENTFYAFDLGFFLLLLFLLFLEFVFHSIPHFQGGFFGLDFFRFSVFFY